MEFKDFSRTSPKIQGLFTTVQTLCLCFLHFHGHRVCQEILRPLFENNIFNLIIAQTIFIIIITCILTFL